MQRKNTEYDVVIIGGGMSGVSAVYHLVKHLTSASGRDSPRTKILLLEARDRLAGRIHAVDLKSCSVELGANWIHGTSGNPVCDLALKYRMADADNRMTEKQETATSGKEYTLHAVREDGRRIEQTLLQAVGDAYASFTERIAAYHDLAENEGREPPAQFANSAGQHLVQDIEQFLSDREDSGCMQERAALFTNFLLREAVFCGCDQIHDVSLRDFGAYKELPGGALTIAPDRRFSDIVSLMFHEIEDMISQSLPEHTPEFEVKLKKEVVRIQWPQDDGENECEIVCQDGSRYTCHQVVVTLPLGVLKEVSESMFEPQLPAEKMNSIRCMGFSDVTKVYMEFADRISAEFLHPDVDELLLVWDNDRERGESDKKPQIILKQESPETWYRTMYSLTRVSDRCLLSWLSGSEAEAVEQMDSQHVARVLTQNVLQKFLHPDFPEAENVVTSKWKSDPFTRGAYSFISNTSSVRDIENLTQPIFSDAANTKKVSTASLQIAECSC